MPSPSALTVQRAQLQLVDLAGRGQRHGVKTDHDVGRPPRCDPALQRRQNGLVGDVAAFTQLHNQDRALAPLRVDAADHRRQRHFRQGRDDRLDVGRIDPFAAGLDQVLGAAGDHQIPAQADLR
uniref:Secreted protein n=1 Tax=Parastrongyloides trichosuri TaxID=131310 RepID=A0A0N4Z3T0_PARTI